MKERKLITAHAITAIQSCLRDELLEELSDYTFSHLKIYLEYDVNYGLRWHCMAELYSQ